ncbi:MAG: ABC transporter permease subunit [Bacteroidota bacterium]
MKQILSYLLKKLSYVWENLAIIFLLSFSAVLLFLPILVNDVPLWVSGEGNSFSPALNRDKADQIIESIEGRQIFDLSSYDWQAFEGGTIIWPLIPYSPTYNSSRISRKAPPFSRNTYFSEQKHTLSGRHWLGSSFGHDLLTDILYSSRTSLLIALSTLLLTLLFAMMAGGLSSFYRNRFIPFSIWDVLWLILAACAIYFWVFYTRQYIRLTFVEGISRIGILGLICVTWWVGRQLFHRIPLSPFQATFQISPDLLIIKLIELLTTFPALMLIISFSIFFGNSILDLILILSLLSWTGLARIIRTESFKLADSGFIQTARGLGMSSLTILFRHYLPNLISPLIIPLSTLLRGLLLIESALSFLNIGLSSSVPSLGRLIAGTITDYSSWWNILFPGLTLCLLILSLHILGEKIRDWFDPYMPAASFKLLTKRS